MRREGTEGGRRARSTFIAGAARPRHAPGAPVPWAPVSPAGRHTPAASGRARGGTRRRRPGRRAVRRRRRARRPVDRHHPLRADGQAGGDCRSTRASCRRSCAASGSRRATCGRTARAASARASSSAPTATSSPTTTSSTGREQDQRRAARRPHARREGRRHRRAERPGGPEGARRRGLPALAVRRLRRGARRRRRARVRQPARRRPDRDDGHRQRQGTRHRRRRRQLRGLPADRRADQPGQLRRRAGQHGTAELVGINSQILSPSGGNIGIGFAIPSQHGRDGDDAARRTAARCTARSSASPCRA